MRWVNKGSHMEHPRCVMDSVMFGTARHTLTRSLLKGLTMLSSTDGNGGTKQLPPWLIAPKMTIKLRIPLIR